MTVGPSLISHKDRLPVSLRTGAPLRIGYLLQSGVPNIRQHPLSGPANHVKQIFESLRIQGHSVCLLAQLNGRIWKSDDFGSFAPVKLRGFTSAPARLFESVVRRIQAELQLPYIALFESLRFAQACRQELAGVDILYERMGWMGYGGALAARRMNKALVLEVNGDHLAEMELQENAPRGLQRYLSTKLTGFAAHQAAHSIATGEGWRRRFVEQWSIAPELVSVIENGSELVELLGREDLQAFGPGVDRLQPVKVAYVGGFEPWHGVPILVRAAAQTIAKGVELQLLLIGTGSIEDELKDLVYSCGLERRVTFAGHVEATELAGYLSGADIGVSPYCGRDEYSGLKLLDYKAAGLAVIASGAAGQPQIIEHGRTGWIVSPCDEAALGAALALLSADSNLRKRLGRQARLEAETSHSWQHTASQIIEILERIHTS